MEKKQKLTFLMEGQIVQVSQGQTALESLLDADFPIDHSCGGNGTCGTCRVLVVEKLVDLASRNDIEAEIALERGFSDHERLCCQIYPVQGLSLQRPVIKKGFE